ncbi:hypothetical protein [Kineococcus sp. SYSU DK018]|uniref:hypothetical protein n=1 Tax=Kineococcus sp. SYSU DK018 TaxID=3383139 RepID=UPI003D7DB4ED
MNMIVCTDTFAAAWLRKDPQPWQKLVSMGPVGFPAYARLRFLPDPTHPGQNENEAPERAEAISDTGLLRRAVEVLASFTTTPQQCYFMLWDGYGLHPTTQHGAAHSATDSASVLGADTDDQRAAGTRAPLLQSPPAGWRPGTRPGQGSARSPWAQGTGQQEPALVRLPERDYYLFEGSIDDFGDWGPALAQPPTDYAPEPAFTWPADHAWCIARDVDPHYAGIGAVPAAIEALIQHPGLDVVAADPAQEQPHYW